MSSYVQLSSKNFLILSWNSGKVYFSAVRARIFTEFELVTLEACHFTTFDFPITKGNQGKVGVQKHPVPWYFYWDCLIIAKLQVNQAGLRLVLLSV